MGLLLLDILSIIGMDLTFTVSKCPPLSTLYCRTLSLTFNQSLESVDDYLHPLLAELKDKQLVKCYLIPDKATLPKPKYQGVVLGGTFDYLHMGHQMLLLTAILQARVRILVGVTGHNMLAKKKNRELIQPIEIRIREVEKYIKRIKPQLHVEVLEINDPYGPAIVRDDFDAIAVSVQTKAGADKINQIRKQRNLKPLQVQLCPLMSENNKVDVKLSSSDIRQHIIEKNKFSLQQLGQYKHKWEELNVQLSKFLKVQSSKTHAQDWWERVLAQYSEYWRFYHTNWHIWEMLEQLERETKQEGSPVGKLNEMEMLVLKVGIWFHDLQYIPANKNNEEVSADLAVKFLKGFQQHYFGPELIQMCKLIHQSILSTKNHKTEVLVTKILIDLDMAILDSNHERYAQYAEGIKSEYLPIAKQHYNEKRAQFLKTLKIDEVFYFRKPQNLQANIKWQINKLTGQKKEEL